MNEVVVTKKGEQAICESILCFQEIEAAVLEGFSEEEIRKLANFLRVNKNEILGEAKKVNPIRSWLRE